MKWKIKTVDISLLEEAEKNANRMSEGSFKRLTENIKKSGGLSSAIACYKRGEKYVIISGHHRYRACVKLRFKEVPIIYADEKDLTRDEIIALQLSHNSLHGEDDKGILKRMFDEIQSVDFKEFAAINIDEIGNIDVDGVGFAAESEHFTITLIMYRRGFEFLKELMGIVEEAKATSDMVIMADGEKTEEDYLTLMKEIRKRFDIKSSNIAFARILELARERMNSYEDRDIKGDQMAN